MTDLRLARRLAALTLVASAVAGCDGSAPDPGALVIGVLSALSGSATDSSSDAVRGAQLAVEVVNDSHPAMPVPLAGGTGLPRFGGAKLSLVSADTGGDGERAAVTAEGFVSQKHALGVVVADSAAVAEATASRLQRLRVPLVDAGSTADYLTELGLDWYFRSGPGDRGLVESAFGLLRRQFAGTARPRVAVVTERGGDSASGAAHIADLAAREGIEIALRHEATGSSTDPGPLAEPAGGGPVDAVVAWAHTPGGAQAITAGLASAAGAPPLLGLGSGFRGVQRPASGEPVLLRAVSWSAELARRAPAGLAVVQLYERRFGRTMTAEAAAAFTAVIALAVAIDAAGSADRAAIRTALRQTALPATQLIMPWGGVRFGADGRNQLAAAVLEAWDGGAFRVVHPAELATARVPWTRSRPAT